MARQLWRPATESDGIPVDVLMSIMNHLNEWKDEHLARVGVPSNFHAEWDFVSAVTACECSLCSISSFLDRFVFVPACLAILGIGVEFGPFVFLIVLAWFEFGSFDDFGP